jgi:hypothetical protein
MKTSVLSERLSQTGSALAITMVMTGIALAILASAMTWSASTTRLTHRSIQYTRSLAAAEAATEKVLTRITQDYLVGGEGLVAGELTSYRLTVPNTGDSSSYGQWEFNDANGNIGRTFVQQSGVTNYILLNSSYGGLRGFATTYTIASHASDPVALQSVVGGVLQEVQLARIPVFQFAMYSAGDMEISCGQPFTISGRVHANKQLYIEPASLLTFQSDVTAVNDIVFARHPLDTRGAVGGSVVYQQQKNSGVGAMSLPIGTNNSPEAIREIIQPPPGGEDPDSPLGRLRYYNQADMILVVSNSGISATSGKFNNFGTVIPTNQLSSIVSTAGSFRDAREEKNVRPVDINVGVLTAWSQTNSSLRVALGAKDVSSLYVIDRRTLAGTELGAVRLLNGTVLPGTAGLTVATARPLYVQGNYNQTNSSNLGTTNTSTTKPASLVADAVTILSGNWLDSKSTASLGTRTAEPTTINAAILTGVVETTKGNYSGGMENFPRFLESWGKANPLTYNGSMVRMFNSLYATNVWGKSDVYDPPQRDWAFDLNFYDPSKLPPLTPSLVKVFRGQWASVSPGSNTASTP